MLRCATACIVLGLWAAVVCGADLQVGPGKPFERVEDALARAGAGDTITVYPLPGGKPYDKVALFVNTPRLAIRAAKSAGAPVVLSGSGFDYSGAGSVPRAIVQFNEKANGCVLEGFELSGAHNANHNGAGVRINQANGVTVRNCTIHHNDMGIMSNGDGTPTRGLDQLIEGCRIYHNGDTTDPGYNHNLYLGGTSVTLAGCEIHSSLTGHNVKSRAHRTMILACYVHDSANREFDLVDARGDTTAPGSDAVLVGNIIAKGRQTRGNRTVIHFGQDGGNEHDGTLYLAHNTIVQPFIAPVVDLSAPKARARLYNNIIWDGGEFQNAQQLAGVKDPAAAAKAVTGACNWLSPGFGGPGLEKLGLEQTTLAGRGEDPPFAAPDKGDYRLSKTDPALQDRGCKLPPELLALINNKIYQFKPPAAREPRPTADPKPDLGAYEAK